VPHNSMWQATPIRSDHPHLHLHTHVQVATAFSTKPTDCTVVRVQRIGSTSDLDRSIDHHDVDVPLIGVDSTIAIHTPPSVYIPRAI
jgi:hypothetical protein